MNVVYDLRYATDHFPGIGAHAHSLLDALLGVPGDEHFRVLWRAGDRATRFEPERLARHPRVTWIEVGGPPLGWRAPWATGKTLRRVRGDVYLSPFYLRPVRPGMPVVLTLHDAMHLAPEVGSPWSTRMRFALAVRASLSAEAVLTSSRFSAGELIRRAGFPAERLHVVPLGVPALPAPGAVRPAGVPARPFALVVGVNRPHKGLAMLVEAWRRMGRTPPLDLVSAGPVDPRFPSASKLARSPHVHTLGRVTPETLAWLYANATLLVFPTRYEGFGLPLIEAFANGCPAIVGDIPALREIGDGAARFMSLDAPGAWADAVRSLLGDAAERARLAAAGRARARDFDYRTVAVRVLAVVRDVVGRAA